MSKDQLWEMTYVAAVAGLLAHGGVTAQVAIDEAMNAADCAVQRATARGLFKHEPRRADGQPETDD